MVQQTSARLIADWQSFSIGQGGSVRFVQPSSDAVALNRVLGNDPSRIFGSLSANGRVYLQNQNGVLFAPGARVDVGSLVATTLQADPAQFMAGRLRLGGAAGAGAVSNEGTIRVAPGGHALLAGAAGQQRRHDRSTRRPHRAGRGGRSQRRCHRRRPADNQRPRGRRRRADRQQRPAGRRRRPHHAAGGRGRCAARRVLQLDGMVRARSIEQRGGEIVLSGGGSGMVAVGGVLDVRGEGTRGGRVQVLGDSVVLQAGTRIDAGGSQGGGQVLIGGAFQGRGPEASARATVVAAGASIDASAQRQGDGGQVVVWSDGATTYGGQIAARGGSGGGNGGQVEVSGRRTLRFSGAVDTRAPAGRAGTLLLDPERLDIGLTADVDGTAPAGDDLPGTLLTYGDHGLAHSSVTAAQVAGLLATSDVTLQASEGMTVSAPIDVAAGGAASTLTLNSRVVEVNAPLTLNNTSLNIDTQHIVSDAIRINAPIRSLGAVAMTSTDIGLAADVSAPSLRLAAPPAATLALINQTAGRMMPGA